MQGAAAWKPIVVGIDGSREAAQAATFGRHVAQAAGTRCIVVHAAADPWLAAAAAPRPDLLTRYHEALASQAREHVEERLRVNGVSHPDRDFTVRLGRPVRVLQQLIEEFGAELVVLGGKRHAALERWFGGSTGLNAVRALPVPVIIVRHPPPRLQRVLVAVDVSAAAAPTIAAAERMAGVFGAELRVLTVVTPVPPGAEAQHANAAGYYTLWEEVVRREVWPLITADRAQPAVRHGDIGPTVELEATTWPADLLVVGSHGKGWVDRLLLGTLTERLLNRLPTSLMVVPVARVVETAARHPERAATAFA